MLEPVGTVILCLYVAPRALGTCVAISYNRTWILRSSCIGRSNDRVIPISVSNPAINCRMLLRNILRMRRFAAVPGRNALTITSHLWNSTKAVELTESKLLPQQAACPVQTFSRGTVFASRELIQIRRIACT